MKISKLRTFTKSILNVDDRIDKSTILATAPRQRLRKMVANNEFDEFKRLNDETAKENVRMVFNFPADSKYIMVMMGERTNPTMIEVGKYIKNLFVENNAKKALPTMTKNEFKEFFKNLFKKNPSKNYPTETVIIDPEQPFVGKLRKAFENIKKEK